ncbi:MAG: DUF748 domain-containing protein [Thermodesulfobacteriota bacterium]
MTHDPSKASPSPPTPGDERQPQAHTEGPSPLAESFSKSDLADTSGELTSSSSRRHGGARRRQIPGRPRAPLRNFFLFVVACLALYALAGFFLAPFLLTSTLPTYLTKTTNRPVTIGSARFNPFSLHITLKNGIIGQDLAAPDDKVDPILSFGRLEGKINPVALFKGGLTIHAIRGNSVFAHLTRLPDGNFNIPTLIKQLTKTEAALDASHIVTLIQNGDFHLTDSRLLFEDIATGAKHNIESISFSLPKRGKDSAAISPQFSAVVDGSPMSIGGQSESSATGQNTRLTFSLEQINLPDFLTYLPHPLPDLLTKGEADIELFLDYQLSADKSYHLEISGSGMARDIWLRTSDKGENKIASASFSAAFQPLVSQLTINKLILEQPELQLHKLQNGSYVFPGSETVKKSSSDGEIFLNTLVVKNGRLSYIDQQVAGGFGVIFNDVNLSMDWSDTDKKFHAYALNCVTSRQTRIASQGKVFFNKGDINGLFILHNLPLPALTSYLPKGSGISITAGIIDKAEADLQFHLKKQHKSPLVLKNMKGTASNIAINHQGKPWLQANRSSFSDATISSAPLRFSMGAIKTSGLLAHLSPEHSLLSSLLFPKKDASPVNKNIFTELHVTKSSLILHDFPFQKIDKIPVKIEEFHATGFNPKKDVPGKINATFSLSKRENSNLTGNFKLFPLAGDLHLQLQKIPLTLFSSKQMQWFIPDVTKGTLDFEGDLNLSERRLTGKTVLNDIIAINPADKTKLISLKKAFSPEIKLGLQPLKLGMDTLTLAGLELYATLSPQINSFAPQFINVSDKGTMARSNLDIQNIELKDSSLHFTDQTVNPVFSHTLSMINGNLTGLENNRDAPLFFNITGSNKDQAVLKSQGNITLFDENFAADFTAQLSDQPLDPLIPYLEPILGHSLSGGIFDMDISYKELSGKVNADTSMTLRHLSLGDTDLGSKHLPLTVALVTDNDGVIRLNIPISGDMTDPSYTFHTAYGKKLRGLISKASVSPFSMLTDFHDPESISLDHILFEAGATDLAQNSDENFKKLRTILQNRPLLALVIKGYSSGSEDRNALLQKKKEEEERKRLAFQGSQSSELIDSYGKEEIAPTTLGADNAAIISVSKEELAALAMDRCQRLKDILFEVYGVDEKRIIISPNTTVVPESGAGLAGTRADFILSRMPQNAD